MLALIIAYCYLPQLSKKPEKDRLLKETFGYSELAKYLEDTVDKPLMTDSYQTTSMMNFYSKKLEATQFFGRSRPSELVRNEAFIFSQKSKLISNNGFFYLAKEISPPAVEGFSILSYSKIEICSDRKIIVRRALASEEKEIKTCNQTVSQWTLSEYKYEEAKAL